MNCKVYKANSGKHLLNISNFVWGDSMYCSMDKSLNLIEVDKEDAEKISEEYKNSSQQISDEESLNKLKSQLQQELKDKGYDLTQLVNSQ